MQHQLEFFQERLPARPYCTDNLNYGLNIRSKIQAIEKRYIQPNHPVRKYWLPYDIDRPGAGYDWEFREAPAPNIIVENPENKHAHLLYGLEIPVYTSPGAHIKPLRYAGAIDCALAKKLDADMGYSGLIVKNPLNTKAWKVWEIEERLYDLDWLADYLDLERYWDRRRNLPDYGLGRNCTLFERLRRWSYRAINKGHRKTLDAWMIGVLHKATLYNDFTVPLPYSEIKSTAKSVGRWVWENFSQEEFLAIQAARSHKAALKRQAEAEKKRQLLLKFPNIYSDYQLAAITGIPRTTVQRLRKSTSPSPISDTSRENATTIRLKQGSQTAKREGFGNGKNSTPFLPMEET